MTALGRPPTFVEGEGYVQSFCLGKLAPGAKTFPAGAITSAHVIKNFTVTGQHYWQVTGTMDCSALGVDCSDPTTGGQYDSVPYRNCGKEPYSGVYDALNPGLYNYIEQGGGGIFCMRVCEGGNQLDDPCNVKNDTAGCYSTMDMENKAGFSFLDVTGTFATRKTTSTTTTTATSIAAPLISSIVTKATTSGSIENTFLFAISAFFLLMV
ncbi:UNVERIFIED_CONTAM: hypothetical protein HDU68_008929 [Siphonaria sp. JEL0065]|nr:hypothetical protein HDU68_008929 [Siphonaria sp. JEL0065]